MNIYPQICFVYKWTQLSTGKWYIGSHYSINAHPNDGYICTSKIVKPVIRENPADWIRVILETGSAKDMIDLECELLTCLNAAKSPYSYNRHNGRTKFYKSGPCSDETKLKTSNSMKGKTKSDEHNAKVGLAHRGRSLSQEHKDKISESLTGNIVSQETKNKISKTSTGRKLTQKTRNKMAESARNRKSKLRIH